MKIVNLTAHNVKILNRDTGRLIIDIPPSGVIAKCKQHTEIEKEFEYDGAIIQITHTIYSDVFFLPLPQPETIFIVSKTIASQFKDRNDLFIPNGIIRDKNGGVVGCRSLGRIH